MNNPLGEQAYQPNTDSAKGPDSNPSTDAGDGAATETGQPSEAAPKPAYVDEAAAEAALQGDQVAEEAISELTADEEGADTNQSKGVDIAPIPRISIQAFCASPQTGAVIQKAANDRRLSKAHVTVQMGGIVGAVDYFKETSTPNLVIVESEKDDESIFDELARLAEVCDPGTKVIVVGRANDVKIYREFIRQGVSEYLVAPLNPIQVIETIASLYSDPEASTIGRTIVFMGTKGGVGASTLAHNVGWLLAEKFEEGTAVTDLDLPFGTASLNFNQDPVQGVADALLSPERVDDVLLERLLVRCTSRLSLLAAPSLLDRTLDLDPISYETVLDVVRKSMPYVIIDLPHQWTGWSKSVLLSADEIVLVATPELSSLRNTMNLFELLKVARPNDPAPHLVLNKVGLSKKIEISDRDFAEAVGIAPSFLVPFDAELFGTAANNGQMLEEVEPKAEAAKVLTELASVISGREPTKRRKSSIFDFLKFQKRSA